MYVSLDLFVSNRTWDMVHVVILEAVHDEDQILVKFGEKQVHVWNFQ